MTIPHASRATIGSYYCGLCTFPLVRDRGHLVRCVYEHAEWIRYTRRP